MLSGETRYTRVDGTAALKAAIAQKSSIDLGRQVRDSEISVASGGKHVIYNALLATLEPGDQVIIPAPYWTSYPSMVSLCRGQPVITATDFQNGYKLTPETLSDAITERTRWLFLNSPSNPSGAVYEKHGLEALADVLRQHPSIWILSDDIYEQFVFNGSHYTMAAVAPDLQDRTVTLNGVSKAYSMTGWRIGWAIAPEPLVGTMAKLMTQSTSNPCSISQAASIAALNGPQDRIAQMRQSYAERTSRFSAALAEIDGIQVHPPAGAFYVLADISERLSKPGDDITFAQQLLQRHNVACIPSSAFGAEGSLRFSVAARPQIVDEATNRLKEALTTSKLLKA